MKKMILVINRDKEKQRWKSVVAEAESNSLQVKRIAAVEMDDLDPADNPYVTTGVSACWASHRIAMQTFLDSESDFALIFEDDFHIKDTKKFQGLLSKSWLGNWDIIQLGFVAPGIKVKARVKYLNFEFRCIKAFSRFLYITSSGSLTLMSRMRIKTALETPQGFLVDDFQPGTHAYLISRTAASAVLNMNNPQFLSADDFYMALARMRSLKFIRPYKSFVSQKKFEKFSGPRFKQFE